MASFEDYFKESMASFPGGGLPIPSTGFETAQKALETVGSMVGALAALGPGATVASVSTYTGITLAGATVGVAAAVMGAVYVGWVIGACIYACGKMGIDSKEFRNFYRAFQRLYSYNPGSSNLAYLHSTIAKGGRGNAHLLGLAATA
jgi:hypothetical protein